jgi:diguanylate cyclase (GGDEF)-like protein
MEADDPLAPYRRRAMQRFALISLPFLLPFALDNFLHGRHVIGAAGLAFVFILAVDAFALRRQRSLPIPYAVTLIPAMIAIGVSIETTGIMGSLWCYPLVLFCYFAMPRRTANICSVAVLVVTSLLVFYIGDEAFMLRFTVSLAITLIVTNTILGIILDLQQKLVDQAITDPLTGALNRRRLDTVLGEAIERNRRKPTPASMLLIDVDHFKPINDHFGHAVGDGVLKQLVALMTGRTRKVDSLFRIGGEEFLLLLADTHEADAAEAAEHLRLAIAEANLVPERRLTVSIGVSELQTNDTVQTWLRRADEALYAAKHAGRNLVVSSGAERADVLPLAAKVQEGTGCA